MSSPIKRRSAKADRPPPTNRKRPITIAVNDLDRAAIEERARNASLSTSAYLRAAGLSRTVKSTADHAAVLELARVNADQGRLGGLLKLWLVEQPGQGAPRRDVRKLLEEIEATQEKLAQAVGRLL